MMFIYLTIVALVLAGRAYYKLRKELHRAQDQLADALAGEWGARHELTHVRQELLEVECDCSKLLTELDRVHNVHNYWLGVQHKLANRTAEIFNAEGLSGSYEEQRARAFQAHVAELLAPYPPLPTPEDLDQL